MGSVVVWQGGAGGHNDNLESNTGLEDAAMVQKGGFGEQHSHVTSWHWKSPWSSIKTAVEDGVVIWKCGALIVWEGITR